MAKGEVLLKNTNSYLYNGIAPIVKFKKNELKPIFEISEAKFRIWSVSHEKKTDKNLAFFHWDIKPESIGTAV